MECGTDRALWLPYVSVPDIRTATERAERLGARVLLEPREGPGRLAQRGGRARRR